MLNWKNFILFTLISLLAGCSCSKEERLLSPTEMWYKATEFDPSTELVFVADTPEGRARRVLCSQYRAEGCIEGSGKRIKVRLVELLVIQYDSEKNACKAALEVGQWYAYNWLFDDVTNEPVLEDYVQKGFEAKKPVSAEDCSKL
ncbi:MAG: hypothetical protein CME63_08135 [Halobacteriovoraceae bacterium]|nr:hypothetical protein [Halobacteriovoraceae bacterium]